MVKKFVLAVLFLFPLLVIVFGVGSSMPVAASPAIMRVPDDYSTIQEAVNAANAGDAIFVSAGTYYEHVTVDKSVLLIGEDRSTTIIDGGGEGTVVSVTADNVTVNGFTIQNSGKNGYWSFVAGIYLYSSSNEISGNTLLNNNYGILFFFSDKNIINGNGIRNNNWGIYACGGVNNAITGNNVTGNTHQGIGFDGLSSNNFNTVTGNIVSKSRNGISLTSVIILGGVASSNSCHSTLQVSSQPPSQPFSNTVSGNIVTDCEYGITIAFLNSSIVEGNTITSNNVGLFISGDYYLHSSNNIIYHNNFIGNQLQVSLTDSADNVWDDGYPAGGNYWSDYNGTDLFSGLYQNVTGSDGIGDIQHTLDAQNKDMFPLIGPISIFEAGVWNETSQAICITCNSTISNFQINKTQKTISFNVTGPDYTVGFCRVTIPNIIIQELWQNNYTVLVDGNLPLMTNNWTDSTYIYMYFTYLHSEHEVIIIPEFPVATILTLFVIITLCAVVLMKKIKP